MLFDYDTGMVANRISRLLVGLLATSAVVLCGTGRAFALPWADFEKLSSVEQSQHILLMVESAEKMLKQQGKHQEAAKVAQLFFTKNSQTGTSDGVRQFYSHLIGAKGADERLRAEGRNPLHVEQVMYVTFKTLGIQIDPKEYVAAVNQEVAARARLKAGGGRDDGPH